MICEHRARSSSFVLATRSLSLMLAGCMCVCVCHWHWISGNCSRTVVAINAFHNLNWFILVFHSMYVPMYTKRPHNCNGGEYNTMSRWFSADRRYHSRHRHTMNRKMEILLSNYITFMCVCMCSYSFASEWKWSPWKNPGLLRHQRCHRM